jgi:hypothetical protein
MLPHPPGQQNLGGKLLHPAAGIQAQRNQGWQGQGPWFLDGVEIVGWHSLLLWRGRTLPLCCQGWALPPRSRPNKGKVCAAQISRECHPTIMGNQMVAGLALATPGSSWLVFPSRDKGACHPNSCSQARWAADPGRRGACPGLCYLAPPGLQRSPTLRVRSDRRSVSPPARRSRWWSRARNSGCTPAPLRSPGGAG